MPIIQQQNCEFITPVYWDKTSMEMKAVDGDITKSETWNFSQSNCSTTIETTELIENASTGSEFYINKNINYGDTLIIFFLLLFAIFGIIKLLSEWFIPKKIDFKR